jgi:acetoin utilization protein AcuB
MFVKTYMTPNPITIDLEATYSVAINTLRKHHIRHLPVVENGRLVGIIVEKDLLTNQPSPATSLSVYEIYGLLEKLKVGQMMSRPVITVQGDCPVEEAARIMCDKHISCLPVMDGDALAGIITETDIFKVLVEVLGGAEAGMRMTLRLEDRVGNLAAIAGQIAQAGGNIIAVTCSRPREGIDSEIMIKEKGANPDQLKSLLQSANVQVEDLRSSARYEPRLFE